MNNLSSFIIQCIKNKIVGHWGREKAIIYYYYRTHYGKVLKCCLRLHDIEMVCVYVAQQISVVGLEGGF